MASSEPNGNSNHENDTENNRSNKSESLDDCNDGAIGGPMDFLTSLLQKAHLLGEHPPPDKVIEDLSLDGIAEYIKSEQVHNIIVMAGAGISTSAGIPDFRSPGSGLYHNLAKYNLPHPQAVFELGYFVENPEPFFQLAKELWPGIFKPTPCHYFIKLLNDKKMLLRHYTQNIDTLERVAELEDEVIVEAHGTFHTSHCLECRHQYDQTWMEEHVFKETVPRCTVNTSSPEHEGMDTMCGGIVKPDIVFFGEGLPERFFKCAQEDFAKADLLIVMGTSLVVQPFASLVNRVDAKCLRLYINLENTGGGSDPLMAMLGYGSGFKFDADDNVRDVFHQATCDEGCIALADKLGWGDELKQLIDSGHEKISAANVGAQRTPGGDSSQSPGTKSEL